MARFAFTTDNDHSASLWIATILSIVYSTLTLIVRAWIKRITIGSEDVALFVAQFLAYGEFAAVIVGLKRGIGINLGLLEETNQTDSAKVFESSSVLFILALATTKVSMGFLLRRIFKRLAYKHAATLCNISLGIAVLWGVASTLAVSINCDAEHILPGHPTAQCTGGEARWLAVTIVDCLTELWPVVLFVYLVTDIQMKLSDKVTTSLAFAFRLGLVPISIFHYRAYTAIINQDGQGDTLSALLILRQVALCYSLLSATWPFSRSLIKDFNTGGLMVSTIDTRNDSHRRSGVIRSGQNDIVKSTTSSNRLRLRNDRATYTTSVHHDNDVVGEDRRFGSEEMIIRREDTFAVAHGE